MAENKTKVTDQNVHDFLGRVGDDQKREDCLTLLQLMEDATGEEARMWGESVVGFGQYHYKYASGREGDSMLTGFSPRKQNLSLYIIGGFDEYDALLNRLGKYKMGKACLYLKSLKDADMTALKEMVQRSIQHMREKYPTD